MSELLTVDCVPYPLCAAAGTASIRSSMSIIIFFTAFSFLPDREAQAYDVPVPGQRRAWMQIRSIGCKTHALERVACLHRNGFRNSFDPCRLRNAERDRWDEPNGMIVL